MKQTKLWLTTIAVLLCSITKVSGEIILTEADGLLKTTWTNSAGVKQYVYTSPVFTLEEATNKLVFTFLEAHTTTNSLNDKNGYPFVALAEFYLHDGEGNRISLDASNFSTNAQEPKEGPLKNICDKNYSTFFHSMWSTGASDYHNITVTLPEGMELKEFQFKYYTRYTSQCVPKKISIRAGNDVVADGTCGDNLTWQLTAGGDLAISGSGGMYDFETEESVPWYEVRNSIKRVVIGDEVTKIGGFAFIYCANLLSVDISESVRSIGYNAFYGTGLLSIFIPANVTEIGVAAFGYCKNMSSMVVDANNPVYDSRNNCNAIIETRSNVLLRGCNTTVIPDGILVIDADGLSGCMGLTSISIPQSVRSIFDYAFFDCEGLRTIEIPDGVNVIGFRAFWDCDNLTSVTISKSVWHIDQQAFGYCYNLGTISVDSGNLDYDSRDNCNAIIDSHTNTIIRGTANTIIPESVKAIGDFAFSGCLPMKSFNIPECVTSIGSYAFCQCNNLVSVNIPQSVSAIGEYAFYNCYNLTSSIEIPESVAKVNDWTFAYCNKLSAISFPEELISIGNYAFFFCSSLKSAIIPNCVETVGERAFMNCYNLESLSISEGLDTISDYAFSRSDKLKKIVVPKRVSHIGEGAFYGCPILETVTIGKNVQTIGGNAFNQCLSLSQIDSYAVIPPKIVGVGTFYKVNPATCKLNVPVGSKAAYQAADVWKAFKLISEKEGLTSIEQLEASSTSLWPTNIYDMNGRLVRENAHSVDGLTGGVYIINGRKVVIGD